MQLEKTGQGDDHSEAWVVSRDSGHNGVAVVGAGERVIIRVGIAHYPEAVAFTSLTKSHLPNK